MSANSKLEEIAASILKRAVLFDTSSRFTESLVCYQEGVKLLMDYWKGLPAGKKSDMIKKKIQEYISRAEKIKDRIEEDKRKGTFHETVEIAQNSRGNGYETVMGRFMDENIESIRIEDPYIRSYNQFCNLVRFCELIVKKCKNLKKITVVTGFHQENKSKQKRLFEDLQDDLKITYNITMVVDYSNILHDRQIMFGNGWVVKIGRGLDYFQPVKDKNVLGTFDEEFRMCRKTTVDVYYDRKYVSSDL